VANISVITEDRNRSTMPKLHKVPTKIIFDLLEKFREVHAETRPPGVDVNLYRQIILSCVEILSLMGLCPSFPCQTGIIMKKNKQRLHR